MYSGPICVGKIAICALSLIDPGAMAFGRCRSSRTRSTNSRALPQRNARRSLREARQTVREMWRAPYAGTVLKFIPEVAGCLQSHDMNANVGGQVPEDSVVGVGFATRPFTVAVERLDLHFEARFNGPLPHRPVEVGLHQGVDVRHNVFAILEQAIGTLKVARHYNPDLPCFEIGGHEAFPGCKVVASYQGLDGRGHSVGRVVGQSRHIEDKESGVDI
jgi:hypothetical protein